MRCLMIAALAATGTLMLSFPAAAIPAGPLSGLSSSSDMLTYARLRRHSMRRSQRMNPGASFATKRTRGAPAGSTGGNGATGSYAAPSGQGH